MFSTESIERKANLMLEAKNSADLLKITGVGIEIKDLPKPVKV